MGRPDAPLHHSRTSVVPENRLVDHKTPSPAMHQKIMIRSQHDPQIPRAVVRAIAVDVVHNLLRKKRTPQDSGCHEPMLPNVAVTVRQRMTRQIQEQVTMQPGPPSRRRAMTSDPSTLATAAAEARPATSPGKILPTAHLAGPRTPVEATSTRPGHSHHLKERAGAAWEENRPRLPAG